MHMTLEMAQAASDVWGFNCGPGALCAVFDKTPDEMRPYLREFEQKCYTNPTLMLDILAGIKAAWGWKFAVAYRERIGDQIHPTVRYPQLALVRIQWGGPWTKPGVPVRARYRKTHWVAYKRSETNGERFFDINAMCVGGWIPREEWAGQLVPWLIRECVPKGDGTWWETHVIEIVAPWEK